MVNMTTYIKNTLLLCLMFCATIFVGCSDDDNDGVTPLPEGQGLSNSCAIKYIQSQH